MKNKETIKFVTTLKSTYSDKEPGAVFKNNKTPRQKYNASSEKGTETGCSLLRVDDNVGVDIVGNLLDDANGDALDEVGIERRKRPQDFIRAGRDTLESGFLCVSIPGVDEERGAYLGDCRICERIIVSCATMHRMFRCGPYANRKSQSLSTSGSGGVHAHSVSTDGNA